MSGAADSWYRNAVIYQIYPRSFSDSNNDGVGDLPGITSRLDYLYSLGVDAIWICPIYKSPMADFGYDVADYYQIDPIFGTMQDFDNLVEAAKSRNIRIIMDLVVNHTSDQSSWFIDSRSSKSDPKRKWYVWKDPRPDGSPPNNWQSIFGGPAWTLDEQTGQYYLHTFLQQQPDLNWENPSVRKEMQKIMRFWIDRGVSGFRVDAVQFISKDLDFADKVPDANAPPNYMSPLPIGGFGPHLREYIHDMTLVAAEKPGCFITFESDPSQLNHPDHYSGWYDLIDNSIAAPFYYGMYAVVKQWDAEKFRDQVENFQLKLSANAMPVYFYGNHDLSRLTTVLGEANARLAALALLTLPGIKVLYYGDEIGMADVKIAPEDIVDIGKGAVDSTGSRDAARTPMQWSNGQNAGFSMHKPWLPVAPDYEKNNVETMSKDNKSLLELYKSLLKLRNTIDALANGKYEPVDPVNAHVHCFKRTTAEQTVLILLNFSKQQVELTMPWQKGRLLLNTSMEDSIEINLSKIQLKPHEGWVVELY